MSSFDGTVWFNILDLEQPSSNIVQSVVRSSYVLNMARHLFFFLNKLDFFSQVTLNPGESNSLCHDCLVWWVFTISDVKYFFNFLVEKCDGRLTIILWQFDVNMALSFAFGLFLGKAAVLTLQDVGSTRSISYFSCCTVNNKSISQLSDTNNVHSVTLPLWLWNNLVAQEVWLQVG